MTAEINYMARRPCVFHLTLHRGRKQETIWVRRYASLENAFGRAMRLAITGDIHVGDIAVLHHDGTGTELGWVKLTAKGKLNSEWIWESEYAGG